MPSVGPVFGTASANDDTVGVRDWVSLANVLVDDGSVTGCVASSLQSKYCKVSGFDLSGVPVGATINGITVSVKRRNATEIDSNVSDFSVMIGKTTFGGDDKAVAGNWTSTLTEQTYGGAADLWGQSWSQADLASLVVGISASLIGIKLSAQAGLSALTVTVHYTEAGGDPAPTVSAVDPDTGTTAGGTAATITGTDFVDGATITFGGSAATSVVFVDDTELTCVTPAHAAGAVDVVVTNPDEQSDTLTDGYEYVAPPVAAFSGTPLSGAAPLSVPFTDASTNTPTEWDWEKNDGSGWVPFDGDPTAQNPTEIFGEGTWSVRLTATNAGGSDGETKTDYVTAAAPVATPGSMGTLGVGR